LALLGGPLVDHTFGKSTGGGRRHAARTPTPLSAVLMTVTRTANIAVVDVSCTGAHLSGCDLPERGEVVELKIEELRLFGTVAWRERNECGIGFDSSLMPFEVDRLRRKAGAPTLAALSLEDRLAIEEWLLGVSR
jgi:hypothetical protein